MPAIEQSTYIYPPRPKQAVPRDTLSIYAGLGWVAQFKFNDSRCLVKLLPDGKVELWNRHAERFRSYHAPDWLLEQLNGLREFLGPGYHVLDGGLLDAKHVAIKDTIVLWDILVHDDDYLVGSTYRSRYDVLCGLAAACGLGPWFYEGCPASGSVEPIRFGLGLAENVFLAESFGAVDGGWDFMWEVVERANEPFCSAAGVKPLLEGVVVKDWGGVLEYGFSEKNNGDWISRSRVSTGRHRF